MLLKKFCLHKSQKVICRMLLINEKQCVKIDMAWINVIEKVHLGSIINCRMLNYTQRAVRSPNCPPFVNVLIHFSAD